LVNAAECFLGKRKMGNGIQNNEKKEERGDFSIHWVLISGFKN
jgi:hypothetical protein